MQSCLRQCVSLTQWHLEKLQKWVDEARAEGNTGHANISAQVRQAIVDRTKKRHDYTGPLQGLLYLAALMERGMVNRHEVANRIRELVREMDALRSDEEKDSGAKPG